METEYFENQPEDNRPLFKSAGRGLACKCPACGEGELFSKFVTVADTCSKCGEELHHHRADDLPAYLNIFIVGHVVLGFMVIVMSFKLMGMWTTVAVTCALCIASALLLMRPLKGMVVGMQWALRMHGFGGHDD